MHWYRAAIPLAPQHKAGEMNGSDLIVIGPWILFAVCLVAVFIRLLHARRQVMRRPARRAERRPVRRSVSAARRQDD